MTFDTALAKAELDRLIILASHNLRRIEIERDVVTAEYFNHHLQRLANDAEIRSRRLKRAQRVVVAVRTTP